MNFNVDAKQLAAIDLSPLREYVEWTPNSKYFEGAAGQEHYRLIAHLSSQLPDGSVIVDIGTYHGLSAVGASFNEKVRVITYDIFDHLPTSKKTARDRSNVEIRVGNCLMDMEKIAREAALVIIDIDPHDGVQEDELVDSLVVRHAYRGMLLLDDVNLNSGMREFYTETANKLTKYGYQVEDLTDVGHFSGTAVFSVV